MSWDEMELLTSQEMGFDIIYSVQEPFQSEILEIDLIQFAVIVPSKPKSCI